MKRGSIMVLEGNIVDINNCFGEVLINEKIYKFPLKLIYDSQYNFFSFN